MLVYEIYDTIENKYYVGITKRTLKARKVEHLRENKCNQHLSRNKMVKGHKLEYINKI